ncbi:folylpolyglutamate synthase/dihydrofolate synthase family protein [uncultured Sunxiuqinia sp.]|uniref:bifunctional folylpolyglutamate synthase/dihydrofolate synthase n=1 Tax=uncultured Sunxiuqinia sp. TaxID=1573825 RepID=UPI002AA93FE6|nr:folylpolyglutamate synthase/dihydrofolate synthase family protein [uncultured Sunxiuqinia sp.]
MTRYKHTLDFLYNRLPMYQRTGPAAYKNTLDNTLKLDELFDFPHHQFKSIHVAGTNGKGSCSHILASVLQEAGYKVGLYTSPHLVDFRERIRVNGEMISENAVVEFVDQFRKTNKSANLEPSFFEITVAMAFDYFRKSKIDIAVIEVGLGGRLDSTNIIQPEVSLITNISLDHTALLGNSIEQIAREKAGVIKSGTPVVVSESSNSYNETFKQTAAQKKASIYFADHEFDAKYSMFLAEGLQLFNFKKNDKLIFPELKTDLLGHYQRKNIGGVLKTIELLNEAGWKISRESIYDGLFKVSKNTGLRGRWEVVGHNPLMICDTAHNEAGLTSVVSQLKNTPWKNLWIVLGLVNDKNLDQIFGILPQEATYFFTQATISRALPAGELAAQARMYGLKGEVISSVHEAVAKAKSKAQTNDLIFIGGSTFVVADYFS